MVNLKARSFIFDFNEIILKIFEFKFRDVNETVGCRFHRYEVDSTMNWPVSKTHIVVPSYFSMRYMSYDKIIHSLNLADRRFFKKILKT